MLHNIYNLAAEEKYCCC